MKILLLLSLIFGYSNAISHEDTVIRLKNNGILVGLPKKYSPASFDRTNLVLTVGNNKISIPKCVTKHFPDSKNMSFKFSASWYHSLETLPDYMSLILSFEENMPDIKILFNLETLEILKLTKLEKRFSENGVNYSLYYYEQEITEDCKEDILKSIKNK